MANSSAAPAVPRLAAPPLRLTRVTAVAYAPVLPPKGRRGQVLRPRVACRIGDIGAFLESKSTKVSHALWCVLAELRGHYGVPRHEQGVVGTVGPIGRIVEDQ